MSRYSGVVHTPPGRIGRPRSEQAREAVLHAVDDLLIEVGYAAMTMKGIAERAGVGRQTVYRWWSTKAEILFEASVIDAEEELAVVLTGNPLDDLTAYLDGLVRFLARSPAGAAYRALLGEAQHDTTVANLIATNDVVGDSARHVIHSMLPASGPPDVGAAMLIGPAFFWILSGRNPDQLATRELAENFLAEHRNGTSR